VISQSIDNKRQIILKTALELFANHGFYATPTSLIAARAGVANGTLFYYFKTKEELINILYLETKDAFFENITKEYNPSGDIKKRIYNIWINTLSWAIQNPNDFKFLQQFSNSPFINQLTYEQISHHYKFIEDQFEEGIIRKLIKNMPVSLLLQISLFQIYGFILYLYENPSNRSNEAIMEMAFTSFWDSIKLL
jgi:AcrR family transcriptional regulator